MIVPPGVARKKFGVYGLGATGLSACASLAAGGADVYCWDENEAARAKTLMTAYGASPPGDWPWEALTALVLSPGVPFTHPRPHAVVRKARQVGVEIVGDIEIFARAVGGLDPEARPRIVGVTGSNGKSTVTALIGAMLAEAGKRVWVGGNIGEPALALPAPERGAVYVLELSSFQLDLTRSLRPDVAVLTGLSPDHLDRHGSMEAYIAAKERLFACQGPDERAVVAVDDPWSQGVLARLNARAQGAGSGPRTIPVSAQGALGAGVFAIGGRLHYRIDGRAGDAGAAGEALRGRHNGLNAAAALAAAMAEGAAPAVAMRAAAQFRGLPHRMETVARNAGVLYVNDSKATNPHAAAAALEAFPDVYWIAGGRAKPGGFDPLPERLAGVRGVFLIGEAAAEMDAAFAAAAAPRRVCADLAEATAAARAAALADRAAGRVKAPTVLLSPACASYDMFRNFEHRGEAFRAAVRAATGRKRGGAEAAA